MNLKRQFLCITWKRYLNLNRRRWFPLLVLAVTFMATIFVLTSAPPEESQEHKRGITVMFNGYQTRAQFINNGARQNDDQQSAKEVAKMEPNNIKPNRRDFRPNFDWVEGRLKRKEKMFGRTFDHGDNCTKRFPHAIIFGVMKCGTEALSTFLSIHPDIAMQLRLQTVMYFNKHYMKGLDWYKNQMPCSSKEQITLEKSPQYFTSRFVPERIYEMNSSIKLIAIMREPISRAISHYSHVRNVKPGLYPLSFEQTIVDPLDRIDRSHETILKSLYSVQLRRWLEYFKIDQIHIVDGDNFKWHQTDELNKIERFLGLKNYITQNHFVYNKEKGFYCLNVTGEEDCMATGKGRHHPEVNTTMIERLKQFFKPYNEDLFKIIGRRFDWGY